MKILIIGSKGNLGQTLANLYKDSQPTAWDMTDLDITKETDVMTKISDLKPDLIFNCAAYNNVDKAENKDRQVAENVNGYAVGYLAKATASYGGTLVHFSSNYVFDGNKNEGYNEDEAPNPISVYGTSKLMGEIELQKNTDKFYLIRSAWLFGGKGQGKKSFIDLMLELAAAAKSIDGVSDEFGNPTYVVDLAQATRALIGQKKPFGIYHLVNSGIASWYDWANEIFKIKNIKAKLASVTTDKLPRKAKRPKYGVLNNTKYIQLRPWTEALKEFLNL